MVNEHLKKYVEMRVEEIFSEKESRSILPLVATHSEIMADIRQDVIDCMRLLYQEGKFKGTRTLNQAALMPK